MSWEDLNGHHGLDNETAKKANNAAREKAAELAQAYNHCFATPEGKRVLEDLTQRLSSRTIPHLVLRMPTMNPHITMVKAV